MDDGTASVQRNEKSGRVRAPGRPFEKLERQTVYMPRCALTAVPRAPAVPRFNAGTGAKINDKSREAPDGATQGVDSGHFLDARAPSHA